MNVKLFGITRDIIGESEIVVPKAYPMQTVGDLKYWLYKQYPPLKQLNSLAVAVNHSYAEDDTLLGSGEEVALIPPVSGG